MNYKRRFFPDIVNVGSKANSSEHSLVSALRENENTIKNKWQKDSDNEHVPAAPKKKMGGFALLDDRDDGDDDDGDKDLDSEEEDVKEPEKVVKEEREKEERKEEKKEPRGHQEQAKIPRLQADSRNPGTPKEKVGNDKSRGRSREATRRKAEAGAGAERVQESEEGAVGTGQGGRSASDQGPEDGPGRMQATLKALKDQGIDVAQIGEKKKVTCSMDRRRNQHFNKKLNEEANEADKKAEMIHQLQL